MQIQMESHDQLISNRDEAKKNRVDTWDIK
jgi:hypothetical protein